MSRIFLRILSHPKHFNICCVHEPGTISLSLARRCWGGCLSAKGAERARPTVGSYRDALSYERGTLVQEAMRCGGSKVAVLAESNLPRAHVQEYLAHKKQPPRLGPP